MEEEQRKAMFDAWKEKEDKKQKDCEPHRWSYSEPKHCVKCGKRFEQYRAQSGLDFESVEG